jgi:hypothetical protein
MQSERFLTNKPFEQLPSFLKSTVTFWLPKSTTNSHFFFLFAGSRIKVIAGITTAHIFFFYFKRIINIQNEASQYSQLEIFRKWKKSSHNICRCTQPTFITNSVSMRPP